MFRLAEKFDKLIKENKRITINGLGYGERAFLLSTIKEKSLLVCLDIDELNKTKEHWVDEQALWFHVGFSINVIHSIPSFQILKLFL